jgi:hypothetical protein
MVVVIDWISFQGGLKAWFKEHVVVDFLPRLDNDRKIPIDQDEDFLVRAYHI